MNQTIFWRIVWKEYRAQRGLWLAALGAALMMQLGLWLFVGYGDAVYGVAFVLPAFFALGSAAVLFAAEREERTADFLRVLPSPPGAVLAGKLLFVLASTIALPVPLLLF